MIIPSSHSTSTVCILLLRILLLLLSSKKDTNNVVQAALPCSTTAHCESVLRPGSECVDGECTNPYYKGGCLKQRLADKWKKTRVCHSEDPPEARLLGYCIPPDPDFDYLEIRVATQDWESAFFQSWVIQIILSEILGIPVTLESGTAEDIVDFYHPGSPLGYGKSYDYEAIERANDVGDCRLFDKFNKDGEYQSCAHILPEIWYGQQAKTGKLFDDGIITRPGHMGALGHQGLYVPIFTGAKDPTLLTYLGLAGEENRRKLAETFLRPTKWKDYCEQVSTTNCTDGGDSTATRPPKHEAEGNRFFVEGLFNGYFRATGKNDCDKNPATCTGHVVDYPCGWTSFVQQQLYHLNIALESDGDEPISNGYTYSQMTEIWAAANATKSNVILQWWTPEALYQTFLGTEAEFQRVSLRPPTEDCVKARIDLDNRCDPNANDTLRYGTKEGSCDEPPYSLERIIASSLEKITNDPSVPEETRSPGYQTIMNIKLTGLQIGKIFDYWLKRNSDKYNFDPRDASCRWVEENFDFIKSLVPKTYPRAVEEKDDYLNEISFYVSVIFSLTSFAFVLVALIGTIVKRSKRAIVYAQRDFLFFLLAGLTMVSVASIILNIPPSDASCMAKDWLVIQGYTFELVPLILKVAAIAQLVAAAAKFKRVQLEKGKLYGAVFTMSLLVFIFLILWTVIDPTIKRTDFRLTEDTTDVGDTIVMRSYYCHSDSDTWLFISTGWHGILLLAATVLAVQTRKLRRDINESGVIAVLVYSHAIFVVLRMLLYYFSDKFTVWNLVRYQSLIFSIDVIAACSIYFFPKIFLEEQQANNFMSSLPGMSVFPGFRSGRSNQFSASNTPVKGSATTAGKESFERKNGDSGGDNHDNDHHGDETGHPEAFENVSFFEDSDQDHAGRDLECFKEALKDEGLWSEKSSKSCSFGIVSGSGELNGTDGSQTLLHKFDDDGDRPNIDSSDQTEHTRGGRRSRRSGRKATTCGSKRKISPSDIKNRRASTGSSLNGPSPFVDEIYENEVELQ